MFKSNGFKIASIYIGTVIGAGFASGQEILQFFAIYGTNGIWGIIISGLLFGIIGSIILLLVHRYKIESYNDWLEPFFGGGLKYLVEIVFTILLVSWYCVMLAGSGALFQEQLGLHREVGIGIMSLITFITFIFSVKGLAIINEVLVPIMVLGIIAMGSIFILDFDPLILSNSLGASLRISTGSWLTSSILYVSYNSIGAGMILCSLKPLINRKRTALLGGILGGIGLGLMAFFIVMPLLIVYTDVQGVEVPMMVIASRVGSKMVLIYGFILWFAMLTTAISNGFVVIQSLEKRLKVNRVIISLCYCILTIPLAGIGFKTLVKTLYPIFGYIGVSLIILSLLKLIRRNYSIF